MKATFSCLSLCVLLLTTASAANPSYAITDLGTISGMDYSVGRAINASAQTTGASGLDDSYVAHVFVSTHGSFADLGTLGGESGVGNGINASGQVAGYSTNASNAYRAFISNGDTLIDIGD